MGGGRSPVVIGKNIWFRAEAGLERSVGMSAESGSSTIETARGWLLNFGEGRRAAVGEKELQEVLPEPELAMDISAPAHCRAQLEWRGHLLPVMDLAVVFGADPERKTGRWVTVVAYAEEEGDEIGFAALRLEEPPVVVHVNDDMSCPLPETSLRDYLIWNFICLSCFRDGDRTVPVIEIARLFSPQGQTRLSRFGAVREHSSSEPAIEKETAP